MIFLLVLVFCILSSSSAITLSVPESAPIGHVVGYVEGKPQMGNQPRFLIVFPDRTTEKILSVDEKSGEITTLVPLDFALHRRFHVLAVPINGGEGIECFVEVEDENDHSPVFPNEKHLIEISEYARIGAEFPLPLAVDGDGPKFNVHKYRIAQGNVNNVFKISTRRVNEALHADLVVNGQLDREYRDKYELIVEAVDGGDKIGRLRVQILILDANDNVPMFSKPRYSISVSSSTAIGSTILTVEATDADVGENAKISFRLQKTRSNSLSSFSLSSIGVLSSTDHLLPGAVHDLVVVASDHGQPSLETTAFVSITVQGNTADEPALDIFWLTDTTTAHLLENTTLGSIVARVSLNEKFRQNTLVMAGCPALCLQQSDAEHIYLVLVCGIFDRETVEEYPLRFNIHKDSQIILEHPVLLTIGDVNDNAPVWSQTNIHISLNRSENENPPVLAAVDLDKGTNGRIRYSVLDTDLLSIDAETGRILIIKELDCSIGEEFRFRIKAEDQGEPPLSSELQVSVELLSNDGQPPHFDKPLYEVMVKEDTEKGTCLLKVQANNSVCGGVSRVKYQWQDHVRGDSKLFSLDSSTGTICLDSSLDFEKSQSHRMSIVATDSNGLSSSCLVWIRVLDVNDHSPVFYPSDYNISLRQGDPPSQPILVVSATDSDHGAYGEVHYFISDETSDFRVDENSGEVYATKPLRLGKYDVVVQAKDGSGTTAEHPAIVHVTVIPSDAPSPSFTQSKYVFRTSEDILPGISIGSVQASGKGKIRYSIYSGDIGRQFSINSENGRITVTRYLDADIQDKVLLNIQAELRDGGSNHTQVLVEIEDHNDNAPEFSVDIVEITIREDQPIQEAFYVVHAEDRDRKKNGEVVYSLISSQPPCPLLLQKHTGQLQLTEELDFEKIKDYRIRVKATDKGVPPRSANVTILLHVSDVNDNAPTFTKDFYRAEIVENSPAMSTILRVEAVDLDSKDNGKVLYRITNGSEFFGIDEKTGLVYSTRELDRESREEYNLTITAEDKGNPPKSSSATVEVRVLDVNDNAPSCASIQTLVVSSDADTHSPFGSLVASDPDNGENGTVVYRIQQSHSLFILTANGDVFFRRQLTESDPSDFRLSVIAADQGSPRKSAVCHVPIKVISGRSQVVLDENMEKTIRIPVECSSDCRMKKINASGVAKWQIQSSEVSSHFLVSNGWLYLLHRPLSLPPWFLTLVLSDKEGRQKHLPLKILPPLSKNLKAVIPLPSSLPIGTKVAVIGEISPNSEWYFIMKNESSLFELDSIGGGVFLSGRLRDHSGENVHLYFQKIDTRNGNEEDIEMEFEIAVPSNSLPVFKESFIEVEIMEDTPIDSVVTTVTATTTEVNGSIVYRMVGNEETFAVDEHSGDLILRRTLDAYEKDAYNVVIEGISGHSKATVYVQLKVLDVNNNRPEIISLSDVFLFPETLSSVIHTVVAKDRDIGEKGRLSFEITENPENRYRIHPSNGELSMERLPSSNEIIEIRVKDSGSPPLFSSQKINIRLMDGGRKWKFFERKEFRFEINESLPVGMEIGRIPKKEEIQLRIVSIPPEFSFDDHNGALKAFQKLRPGRFSFTVLATSSTGEMDWAKISVTVLSFGEDVLRISSSSCGSVTVPENRELEALKRIIVTGGKGNVRFRIQGHQKTFSMNETTGEISSSSPLDREMKSEYLLVIIAEENGRNDSCTVRITVSDENDNAPQFSASTPQMITISDSIKTEEILQKISALDLDIGINGRIVFDLLEDPSRIFDMDSNGNIIYKRDLASSQKEWMIRIRARDCGFPMKSSDRFIRIRDERSRGRKTTKEEISFLRAEYVVNVDEGMEKGASVVELKTNSRDSRITYSIVEGNVDNAFQMDSEGKIRTSQELDYEIMREYSLKIIATGGFREEGKEEEISTSLKIYVNNLNDNPPSFARNKNRKILESVPVGSYITTFTANDADMNDVIEYTLEKEEKRFSIDRYTGVVHSLVPLDYEEQKEIHLKVFAFDGKHRVEGGFSIFLVDVNDNAPEFPKNFYDIQISPSTQMEDVILKIGGIDRDSGENGRISYSLEGQQEMFSISADGSLSLISPISLGLEYLLTIVAMDHGHPRLSSSVPLRIRVAKKNSTERPQFTKNSYEFSISEDVPLNVPVANVSISSKPLWYRIVDAEAAKKFRIDRFGRISLILPLDREKEENHVFEVEVGSETQGNGQNSSSSVTIRVLDVNDNPPRFSHQRIPISIRDGLKNGDLLYRLSASDADSGENGHIVYRILSGNDYGIISVAPESGAIMFNEWNEDVLSSHRNGSWITVVEASDRGHPSRFSLVHLEISVSFSSWSATAPFFVQSQYVAFVEENSPSGSTVFLAKAVNRAGIPISGLSYSLKDNDGSFSMNSSSGEILLRSGLDFESRPLYRMTLSASDSRGRSAVVSLEIRVIPIDEYPPVFTQNRYTFQIPLDSAVGSKIGKVVAVDGDGGIHGRVQYGIEGEYRLVAIDANTGEISLRKSLTNRQNLTIEQITVVAYSGPTQRNKATVYLEIGEFSSSLSPMASSAFKMAAAGTIGLFVFLLLLLFGCVFCRRREQLKQVENNPRKQIYSVTNGKTARMGGERSSQPQQTTNSMTSSVSTSSGLRSALSHREFTSTRSQPDSGIDPDTLSQTSSVTEYLVALGVNPNPIPPKPRHRRRDTVDSHLNELIYAKVDDVIGPGPLDVSKRLDYFDSSSSSAAISLRPAGCPTYQPMSEIFSEISRMHQEEEEKRKAPREYVQIEI